MNRVKHRTDGVEKGPKARRAGHFCPLYLLSGSEASADHFRPCRFHFSAPYFKPGRPTLL
jgi:hypothetical protein